MNLAGRHVCWGDMALSDLDVQEDRRLLYELSVGFDWQQHYFWEARL